MWERKAIKVGQSASGIKIDSANRRFAPSEWLRPRLEKYWENPEKNIDIKIIENIEDFIRSETEYTVWPHPDITVDLLRLKD